MLTTSSACAHTVQTDAGIIHSHTFVFVSIFEIHSRVVLTHLPVCVSERAALIVLGFTQVSWDNESGEEQQPLASFLSWAALTDEEKAAGTQLGYTATNWDTVVGSTSEPAVANKGWAELTSCPDGEFHPHIPPLVTFPPIRPSPNEFFNFIMNASQFYCYVHNGDSPSVWY